jgi:hypothetical protein
MTTTQLPRVPSPHTACPTPGPGETTAQWTDRLTAAGAASGVRPRCSIGCHDECSSWADGSEAECRCVCHEGALTAEQWAIVEFFDSAEAAPESFDPLAAVRRVNALADELDEEAAARGLVLDRAVRPGDRIRAAIARRAPNGGEQAEPADRTAADCIVGHEPGWNRKAQNPTSTASDLWLRAATDGEQA